MPRTGQPAIDYTLSRVGQGPPPPTGMPDDGLCLQFVREDFAVPAKYASAIDAWNACATQHPGDRNPPPAVPVWFLSPSIYDHVVFHCGGGRYVTTFNDDVREYPAPNGIDAICRDFDASFLGWGEEINGVYILEHITPPDTISEDTMARLVQHPSGSLALVGPGAAFQILHNMDQANSLLATGQATGPIITLADGLIWNTTVALAEAAGLYVP